MDLPMKNEFQPWFFKQNKRKSLSSGERSLSVDILKCFSITF